MSISTLNSHRNFKQHVLNSSWPHIASVFYFLCNQETFCQSCVREQGSSRILALSSMRWYISTALGCWNSLVFSSLVLTSPAPSRTTALLLFWHNGFTSDSPPLPHSRLQHPTVPLLALWSTAFLRSHQTLLCSCIGSLHSPWCRFCVAGSKTQSNRADTGLWRLSRQGPGWAHGRGHHCLPEVGLTVCT